MTCQRNLRRWLLLPNCLARRWVTTSLVKSRDKDFYLHCPLPTFFHGSFPDACQVSKGSCPLPGLGPGLKCIPLHQHLESVVDRHLASSIIYPVSRSWTECMNIRVPVLGSFSQKECAAEIGFAFLRSVRNAQQVLGLRGAFHKCIASPGAVESFTDVSCMDFVEVWHGVECFLVFWINLG